MSLPMSERLMNFGHKVVVSGLAFVSLWGVTFIGAAGVDIYTRYKERKRLKETAEKSS
jgi:hypothetical protein